MTVKFETILKNKFNDLIVDEIYEGGNFGNKKDDVISKLFKVSNSGGIRYLKPKDKPPKIIVLFTTGEEIDWPDEVDIETGVVTYFGDNKTPGVDIDSKKGNKQIKAVFDNLENNRSAIPPIFIVKKQLLPNSNSIKFIGLAVPGTYKKSEDDLSAIWKSKDGSRFQNYKIKLSILNISTIKKEWIEDIYNDKGFESEFAPSYWLDWINTGNLKPLKSSKVTDILSKDEQLPSPGSKDQKKLDLINNHFSSVEGGDFKFEKFVNHLIGHHWDNNVVSVENTRGVRDGGIDGLGLYRIGIPPKTKAVEFYIQAKRYTNGAVGVKDVARLISRIKNRQFGIMVTTSYIAKQTQEEVAEDNHPILFIAAIDIINLLKKAGIGDMKSIQKVLDSPNDEYNF